MKQTEYLEGVLNYYRECDITPGDPNEGRWEDAHTPYPRGMGESTVPLLHEHHVIHDLWQSDELGECHFFHHDVTKVLYSPNCWVTGWFELCEVLERYHSSVGKKGGRKGGRKNVESGHISALGSSGLGGRKNVESGHIYSIATPESCSKGGKISGRMNVESGHLLTICGRGGKKGSKTTNSQKWQCLVTGKISTAGPLTWYQNKRGIDTKLRKRIK